MIRLVALDLGSNSFHLLDAQLLNADHQDGEKCQLNYGLRLKDKVQLGAGLDADHNLSQVAINRGLKSIKKFDAYIKQQNIQHVVALATNTLRIANNSDEFIESAENILNKPITVISGDEEAKLIFDAVANELIDTGFEHDSGLVIDIGGGSTEFAIGNAKQLMVTESIEMGCVSYYQRFFADGKIYMENVRAAQKAARLEIEPRLNSLNSSAKHWIAGTSGSIQSIAILAQKLFNADKNSLSRENIKQLEAHIIEAGHVQALDIDELDSNRRVILPSGLSIMGAIFDTLAIDEIMICQTSLCEGMLLGLAKEICSSEQLISQ